MRTAPTSGTNETPDRLVTAPEAARRVGVNPSTVHYWIKRGYIKSYRREGQRDHLVDSDEVWTRVLTVGVRGPERVPARSRNRQP